MACSITGERGALHTLGVIKSDWTAVIMRNGGCVPGHSIRAAFHQWGPAAVSPYVYLLEQTTGRLPTGTHTHIHTQTHYRSYTHAPSFRHMGQQLCMCTNAAAGDSHICHEYKCTLGRAKTRSHDAKRHILSGLSWVTFITFSLSLAFFGLFWAHSTGEHNKRITIQTWQCNTIWEKQRLLF